MFQRNLTAKTLIRLRQSKNLSQQAMAEGICTQSLLSRIESGETKPTFQKVLQLLNRCQVSLAEFEYLLETEHNEIKLQQDYFIQQIYQLEFSNINNLIVHPHIISIDNYSQIVYWLNTVFDMSFPTSKNNDRIDIAYLLNQDEFFNNDIPKIIFALPSLELEAAKYTFTRLLAQISSHQIQYTHPLYVILSHITIAAYYKKSNLHELALTHYQVAFTTAKDFTNVNYTLYLSLILFEITEDTIMLDYAKKITTIFSKDILFNYWYNIIIK